MKTVMIGGISGELSNGWQVINSTDQKIAPRCTKKDCWGLDIRLKYTNNIIHLTVQNLAIDLMGMARS